MGNNPSSFEMDDRPAKRLRLDNDTYVQRPARSNVSHSTMDGVEQSDCGHHSVICYGMLTHIQLKNVKAEQRVEPKVISAIANIQDSGDRVQVKSLESTVSGSLDDYTSRLVRILEIGYKLKLQFNFVAGSDAGKRKTIRSPAKKALSEPITISITLYGPRDIADTVGEYLVECDNFLQLPTICDLNCCYYNPQDLQDPHEAPQMTFDIRHVASLSELEKIELQPDPSNCLEIEEKLEEAEVSDLITTPLHSHQKQALFFMLGRERINGHKSFDEGLWKLVETNLGGSTLYHNIITSETTHAPSPKARGGILADAMGLGKSLSVLSLIATSCCGSDYDIGDSRTTLSKGKTLLVVPFPMLNTWIEEIQTHLRKSSLSWHIHHRINTLSHKQVLSTQDIVVTTYGVLASEYGKLQDSLRPLFGIHWQRVVLDEAHFIRGDKTLRAIAAFALHAHSRWAVTGTPIQNRLDDLASLLFYLRIFPEYCIKDVKDLLRKAYDNETSHQALRSICLRRPKAATSLPSKTDHIHHVDLDTEENELYSKTNQATVKTLERFNCLESNTTLPQYSNILVKINSLRHICNLGMSYSSSASFHEDIQSREQNDLGEVLQELLSADDLECGLCGSGAALLNDRESPSLTPQARLSILYVCGYAVCDSCNDRGSTAARGCPHTPWCQTRAIKGLNTRSEQISRIIPPKKTPSKIATLMKDIEATPSLEKCVVFSMWTSTLDCIEACLYEAKIPAVRVDGSMNGKKREKAIAQFKSDTAIKVVLFSLGCGANGLNLTVANHAFLMEPQWNPMLEDQALDRVHRIGQEKPVTTIRYVVRNSFEQNIRNLQREKRNLIKHMFDSSRPKSNWVERIRSLLTHKE